MSLAPERRIIHVYKHGFTKERELIERGPEDTVVKVYRENSIWAGRGGPVAKIKSITIPPTGWKVNVEERVEKRPVGSYRANLRRRSFFGFSGIGYHGISDKDVIRTENWLHWQARRVGHWINEHTPNRGKTR